MINNNYYLFKWHKSKLLVQLICIGETSFDSIYRVPNKISHNSKYSSFYVSNKIVKYKEQKFIKIAERHIKLIPLLRARLLIDDNKLLNPIEFKITKNKVDKIKRLFK